MVTHLLLRVLLLLVLVPCCSVGAQGMLCIASVDSGVFFIAGVYHLGADTHRCCYCCAPPPTPKTGLKAFFTTPQLDPVDKVANSLALGTSPIVRALFDPEGGMRVS